MKTHPLTIIAFTVLSWLVLQACQDQKKQTQLPRIVGSEAQVTATLDLIKATRAANQPFLDAHGIIRDNLSALESAANNLTLAPGNEQLQRIYTAALDTAINRAHIIATRAAETAEDKKRAADLRDKLMTIRRG